MANFHSISFHDFLSAAQRAKEGDHLIVQGNHVIPVSEGNLPDEDQNIHQRTWRAFSNALSDLFPEKRVKAIGDRYGGRDWWDRMSQSNFPLEKGYVERFGVGAATAHTFNLNECRFPSVRSLESLSVDGVRGLFRDATKGTYLGPWRDPRSIHGSPEETHQQVFEDFFLIDKQRNKLYEGVGDLLSKDPNIPAMHPYYSRLTMGIVNFLSTSVTRGDDRRDFEMVIPAPTGEEGKVDYYKVYDIISKEGLTAFAFAPISKHSDLSPLVIFRCTKQAWSQSDFIDSVFQNLQDQHGESGYLACKGELDALMEDPNFLRGKKPIVCGYSLGGNHATHFMKDHWRGVQEAVLFNFCGNQWPVIRSIADEINALPPEEIPPGFYLHRNESNKEATHGDWVNRTGDAHCGWGIRHPKAVVRGYQWVLHDKERPENYFDPWQVKKSFGLHGVRPMDSTVKYDYVYFNGGTRCDEMLEVTDRTIEGFRRNIGQKYFYSIGIQVWKLVQFIFRAIGFEKYLNKNF